LKSTNRLLVGPFADKDEAQGFINRLAAQGTSSFHFRERGVPEGRQAARPVSPRALRLADLGSEPRPAYREEMRHLAHVTPFSAIATGSSFDRLSPLAPQDQVFVAARRRSSAGSTDHSLEVAQIGAGAIARSLGLKRGSDRGVVPGP